MVEQNGSGKVASIDKVADELQVGEDKLSEWAASRSDGFLLSPDDAVLPGLGAMSDWAGGHGYQPVAVTTFLQVADFWLVAHELAHKCIIVTHEIPTDTTSKIKILNACLGPGLRCINPFELPRRERARFVLGAGEVTT